MAAPRVMLLSITPPGYRGVGVVYLRDLLLSYPRERICWFTFNYPTCGPIPTELAWVPVAYEPLPRQRGIVRFGQLVSRASGFCFRSYFHIVRAKTIIARAVRFGRQHNVQLIWAALDDPMIIRIARHIAEALKVPLVSMVWDPPEYQAMYLGYDPLWKRRLLDEFGKVMRASVRCSVASEPMKDEYQTRYGVECVAMAHGIHPELWRPPATRLADDGRFVIGFAGGLYAQKEWEALLSALAKCGWRIEGREVTVRLLASSATFCLKEKLRIEYLGWRSLEETIELMSEVDVAYVPYWFDEAFRVSARLCFPGKITTYLAAGRPILFHGPEDSSPVRFLRRFPAGICCHSLDESEIIRSLSRFVNDPSFYASAAQAGRAALKEELSLSIFRRRFADFIGIREEELLSMPSGASCER